MADTKQSITELARQSVQELSAWRDELKLRLHLAGMDMSDAWTQLQPHLAALDDQLRQTAKAFTEAAQQGDLSLKLHLGLMDARDRWRAIQDDLAPFRGRLREAGQKAGQAVGAAPDEIKLQARLARMEAKELLEGRRRELDERMQKARRDARRVAQDLWADLQQAISEARRDLQAGSKAQAKGGGAQTIRK